MRLLTTRPRRVLAWAVARVLGVCAAIAVSAAPAAAQVEVVTQLGLYVPTREVFVLEPESGTFEPAEIRSHERALSVGSRVTFWWSDAWGVEAAAGYVPSALETVQGTFEGLERDAHLVVLSGRAVRRLGPSSSGRLSFQIAAGVGLIVRGGSGYRSVSGTTDLSFAWGGGLRVRLAPALALRWDLESHAYSTKFRFTRCENTGGTTVVITCEQVATESRFQNDLLLLHSLSVALGGP